MYRQGFYSQWENEVIIDAIYNEVPPERVAQRLNRTLKSVKDKMEYEGSKIRTRQGSGEEVLNAVSNRYRENLNKQKEARELVASLKIGKSYKIYDRQRLKGEEVREGTLVGKDKNKFIIKCNNYLESFRILDIMCGDIEIIDGWHIRKVEE